MRCPNPTSWFICQALHLSQFQLGAFSSLDPDEVSSKAWLSMAFGEVLCTADNLSTSRDLVRISAYIRDLKLALNEMLFQAT